jgi:hypothetical protein
MHFRFITNIRRTIKREIVLNYWKEKKRKKLKEKIQRQKRTFFCNSVNEKNKNRTGKNYRNIKKQKQEPILVSKLSNTDFFRGAL